MRPFNLIKKYPDELKAALAAMGVYCAMYAFRKPFTMLTFDELSYFGIHYKIWLVSAQLMGYALSKILGIKIISELTHAKRLPFLLIIIGIAWCTLFLFALIPPPYSIFILFLNGLPLGLVWGIVFSYLEGRRSTDIMGVVLASSFIFSSGFVKSVGGFLLKSNVSDHWMPFVTGALFIIPFVILIFFLNAIPPPTEEDISQRSVRMPMNSSGRKQIIVQWAGILIPLTLVYIFYTALRDFRDNFTNELFIEMHISNIWMIARGELIITVFILLLLGSFVLVKDHRKAISFIHLIMMGAFAVILLTSLLYKLHLISGLTWYMMLGVGVFAGYIPFNCILADRLIAVIKSRSNAGFIMYWMDAFGYGSVLIMLLLKEWVSIHFSYIDFYIRLIYVLGFVGLILVLYSYFIGQKLIPHHE
ncbi:MAG: DUF5690 family protein [Saprospiraceae bacterium]